MEKQERKKDLLLFCIVDLCPWEIVMAMSARSVSLTILVLGRLRPPKLVLILLPITDN